MRASGHQMAMSADEFGGVAGLVTLKQLVEEIVGPVGEEGEAPEEEVVALGENTFEVDAGLQVKEANERVGPGPARGRVRDGGGVHPGPPGPGPSGGRPAHLRPSPLPGRGDAGRQDRAGAGQQAAGALGGVTPLMHRRYPYRQHARGKGPWPLRPR